MLYLYCVTSIDDSEFKTHQISTQIADPLIYFRDEIINTNTNY